MPIIQNTVYRQHTQETVDAAFDQYAGTSPAQLTALFSRYAALSESVRRTIPCRLDVAYGEKPEQRLDVFPAAIKNSPMVVYVHGGGYRTGTKEDRAFPAALFTKNGVTWIPVEYTKLPDTTISEIVGEICQAVAWVYRNAEEFDGDRNRIFITGNSAGANLAGLAIASDWSKYELPRDVIKGAALVASNFDLVSRSHAYRLSELFPDVARQSDPNAFERISAMYHLPNAGVKMFLAVGDTETEDRQRIALDYYENLRRAGFSPTLWIAEGRNHMSIIGDYSEPSSPLVTAMFEQMSLAPPIEE